VAEEGRTEGEKRGIKEMKHTFASSSRHPASCRPSLVTLGSCVTNEGTCKNVCKAKHFCAKGNTLKYWPFSFIRIFVLKVASFPNAGYFRVSDACNSNQ
jgi:hypothetical protein